METEQEVHGRVQAGSCINNKERETQLPKEQMKPEAEEDLLAEVQRLRAENAYLKKIECLGCREGTAREKAKVIWELRHEHKLSLLLPYRKAARSGMV